MLHADTQPTMQPHRMAFALAGMTLIHRVHNAAEAYLNPISLLRHVQNPSKVWPHNMPRIRNKKASIQYSCGIFFLRHNGKLINANISVLIAPHEYPDGVDRQSAKNINADKFCQYGSISGNL